MEFYVVGVETELACNDNTAVCWSLYKLTPENVMETGWVGLNSLVSLAVASIASKRSG
jgi:hypothetical protein